MKKQKLKKWLSNRNDLIITDRIVDRLAPFISEKVIDRSTSSDLLLDEYFRSIDRAITTPGRNVLYALLHAPLDSEEEIESRRNFLSAFSENGELSSAVKTALWKVRFSPAYSVNPVLFENNKSLFTREKLAMLLLVFVFFVIAIPLFFSHMALYSILLFCVISFLFFARNLSIYDKYIPGLINLSAHYNTARKLIRIFSVNGVDGPQVKALASSMPDISSIIPSLRILCTGSFTAGDPLQLLLFWLKNLFCLDLLAYNKAVAIINSNRGAFIKFYCCYGMIDALLVVSEKLASGPERFCKAEFHSERGLSAMDIYHPLLVDAVSNSISIERGILLTGSNMSGKSTFLRTIGLNAVLAQTIGYCHAAQFRLPILNQSRYSDMYST